MVERDHYRRMRWEGVAVPVLLPEAHAFFSELALLSHRGKFRAEDFLALVAAECDFISRQGRQGQGLTQLTGKELASLGWTGGEFWRAPTSEQISYCARYLERRRTLCGIDRWTSPAQLWQASRAGRQDGELVIDAALERNREKYDLACKAANIVRIQHVLRTSPGRPDDS